MKRQRQQHLVHFIRFESLMEESKLNSEKFLFANAFKFELSIFSLHFQVNKKLWTVAIFRRWEMSYDIRGGRNPVFIIIWQLPKRIKPADSCLWNFQRWHIFASILKMFGAFHFFFMLLTSLSRFLSSKWHHSHCLARKVL